MLQLVGPAKEMSSMDERLYVQWCEVVNLRTTRSKPVTSMDTRGRT